MVSFGNYWIKIKINYCISIVTECSEAVKTGVERCALVTVDVTEHSVISFKHLVYQKNYITLTEFNELYIPCNVPFFVLCAILWKTGKVWFEHK
jgi:hypothetical protein